MTACAQCGVHVLDGEAIATLHGAYICRACYERTCNPHHGRPPEYGRPPSSFLEDGRQCTHGVRSPLAV